MSRLLRTPSRERAEATDMARFIRFVNERHGLNLKGYDALYRWSVAEIPLFWDALWSFAGIASSAAYGSELKNRAMPGARWFEGARLNFAENLLRRRGEGEALIFVREGGEVEDRITYGELYRDVARLTRFFCRKGCRGGRQGGRLHAEPYREGDGDAGHRRPLVLL